jgi:hypothetical protein
MVSISRSPAGYRARLRNGHNASDARAPCSSFCKDDSDCPASDAGALRCVRFAGNFSWASSSEVGGICVESCEVWSDGCGPEGTCAALVLDADGQTQFPTCHHIGSGTDGSTCTNRTDCAADMDCIAQEQPLGVPAPPPFLKSPEGTCRPLCNAAHPCTAFLCKEVADGLGFCP